MDPFHGLIVCGVFGLVGWSATAAAVGAGLRWLDLWSRRQPAALPPRGADAEMPDAA
jgi:hypothetical protein